MSSATKKSLQRKKLALDEKLVASKKAHKSAKKKKDSTAADLAATKTEREEYANNSAFAKVVKVSICICVFVSDEATFDFSRHKQKVTLLMIIRRKHKKGSQKLREIVTDWWECMSLMRS